VVSAMNPFPLVTLVANAFPNAFPYSSAERRRNCALEVLHADDGFNTRVVVPHR
jgi:hypothetical protein